MFDRYKYSIARIVDFRKNAVGAGVLVGPRLVITCAHVINDALALKPNFQERPGREVKIQLDFPFRNPNENWFWAQVILWDPMNKKGRDLALLELDADQPISAKIASFAIVNNSQENIFHAFSFPNGYEDGLEISGTLGGSDNRGRVFLKKKALELSFLQKGFSGTGVWDEKNNQFVGIIVEADVDKNNLGAVGVMIPANLINGFIHNDRKIIPSNYPASTIHHSKLFNNQKLDIKLERRINDSSDRLTFPSSGAILIDSPFYIERKTDKQLYDKISDPGTISTIYAKRQFGKSSLLIRAIKKAKEKGVVVFIDCSSRSVGLKSLEEFLWVILNEIIFEINTQLNVDIVNPVVINQGITNWEFDRYLEINVLPLISSRLFIFFDEINRLYGPELVIYDHFFALLKSWTTKMAQNDLWGKVNTILAISTHLLDMYKLPEGTSLILLEEFSTEEILKLDEKYGSPLKRETENDEFNALIGYVNGHPFLVHQILQTMVKDNLSFRAIIQRILESNLPEKPEIEYHLAEYIKNFKKMENKDILDAMHDIIFEGKKPAESICLSLIEAGLIQERDGILAIRYKLYESYFRRKLQPF